jgi:type IV pilus assembly protein PilC
MIFNYTARDQKKGEVRKGQIDAASQKQAVEILRSRNLIPTSVVEKTGYNFADLWGQIRGVSELEKAVFTRQLSTMVSAGLPLARALEILVEQTSNPRFHMVLSGVLRDIRAGGSLSSALGKHPDVFPAVYISLVKAGEASGSLDKMLVRLADNMEKRHEFIGRTRGAMIYPAIVITGMIIVFIIMMVFVIPKITGMFEDLGATLPLPTRVLIALSNLIIHWWWAFLLLVAVAVLAVWRFSRTTHGSYYLASLGMRLPVFGSIVSKSQLTELTRTLGLLVASGVPILSALDIARGSIGNVVYREAMREIAQQVEKGAPLSQSLERADVFPVSVGQIVSVGEETGKVDEVLFKVSEFYEREVDQAIRNISTALEPLIMVVLGVMVGFLILAVILPIYSLTSQL